MALCDKYLWKDALVDRAAIDIDVFDRGYQYGDGIYEVIHVYNGVLFTQKEHLDRLERSAARIEMNLKYDRAKIDTLCERLVSENGIDHGYIYIQVTRGEKRIRNHDYPVFEEQEPVYSGFAVKSERNPSKIYEPSNAITFEDLRGNLCDVKSLNLLPNALAIHAAKKQGARKAILIRDGFVTEEKSGNALVVKNGAIYSHPDGTHILPGVTKLVIKRKCLERGIPYIEEAVTVEQLFDADEVLVVDTNSETVAVNIIDGKTIGDGTRGKMAQLVQEMYEEAIIEQCGKL